jgi:hypothetical protein
MGSVLLQLPSGPSADSYNLNIFIKIYDDLSAQTTFYLDRPIQVKPLSNLQSSILQSLSSNDFSSPVLKQIISGNMQTSSKSIIMLAMAINDQSPSSSTINTNSSSPSEQTKQNAILRDFFINNTISMSVSDLSSIKLISSVLSATTTVYSEITNESAVINS